MDGLALLCNLYADGPVTLERLRAARVANLGELERAEPERLAAWLHASVPQARAFVEEARKMASGFKVGLIRVEKYFEGTKITAYAGPPPEKERTDYCWGGCPGAIEEAIEILRIYDKKCDEKMPRLHVVFGDYDGPIDAKPGEKVVFIGDCVRWKGKLNGADVSVESSYVDRAKRDPYEAKYEDIFVKMYKVGGTLLSVKKNGYVRFKGCPVSVAEQVLALVSLGGTKNPYLSAKEVLRFNKGYLGWKSVVAVKRIMGQPYQIHGPAERGEGAPEQ